MLDAKTQQHLAAVRGRTLVEISVRLAPDAIKAPPGRPDQLPLVEKETWDRLADLARKALAPFSDQGLRILRTEKAPLGLIVVGPASAWRAFLDQEKALVADPDLVFRQYRRPFIVHGTKFV